MSEPAPERIESDLWTFVQIVNHSSYFPMLVRGAAQMKHKTYTPHLLESVAGNPAILQNLRVPLGGSVDTMLEALVRSHPEEVDNVILTAVEAYTPPPSERGNGNNKNDPTL